jgi:alpha-ketoglutaric semialdehyde dehydrogenase
MKPSLLLVDLQGDFLDSTGLQPAREQLISQTAAVLHGCRQKQIPVIHIWTTLLPGEDRRLPHWKKANRWLCVAGTGGHKTPVPLRPLKNEVVISKTGFNGFAGGELDAVLKKLDCDTVIVAGVHLHTCVRTVAAESLERGWQVVVADRAVASNDPVYAAATRRWLSERNVEFLGTPEIFSRLDGHTASPLVHRSPRETENILFETRVSDANQITAAAGFAQAASKKWRQTNFLLRAHVWDNVATGLETAALGLALQMAFEIGKPIAHGLEEVRRAAANIRDVFRRAAAHKFTTREPAGIIRHEPVGVVALISPWNNPVAIPIGKIAPALAYGNTVVWKPAPAATQIAKTILRIMHAAGVPEGAVQLVTGDHTTAQSLAAAPQINAVSITGSIRAGHAIQEICARRFLPLQAELGGNNAAIIWDVADLPRAAAQIAGGAFGFAGQRCTANRRVIVNAAHLKSCVATLKEASEKLAWGDPLEQGIDIGPVIDTGKRDEQMALITEAQNSGAASHVEFLFNGRANEPWVKAGAYACPVIAVCDQPAHPLVQEETMSPLLVVQPAETFERALELCNGVRHGLAAALFSQAADRQQQFLAGAQAGIVKINSATAGADVSLPFGGWKMSGFGPPEHGPGDVQFYTRQQAVYGV